MTEKKKNWWKKLGTEWTLSFVAIPVFLGVCSFVYMGYSTSSRADSLEKEVAQLKEDVGDDIKSVITKVDNTNDNVLGIYNYLLTGQRMKNVRGNTK